MSTDSNALCNFFNLALSRVAGTKPRKSAFDDAFRLIGLHEEPSLASSALFAPGILLDQGPVLAGAAARFWPIALRARFVAAVEHKLAEVDARVGAHAIFVINAVYGRSLVQHGATRALQRLIASPPPSIVAALQANDQALRMFRLRLEIEQPKPTPFDVHFDQLVDARLARLSDAQLTVFDELVPFMTRAMAFVATLLLHNNYSLVGSGALYWAAGGSKRHSGDLDVCPHSWRNTDLTICPKARRSAAVVHLRGLLGGAFGSELLIDVAELESCVSVHLRLLHSTGSGFKIDIVDPVGAAAAPMSLTHNVRVDVGAGGRLQWRPARPDPLFAEPIDSPAYRAALGASLQARSIVLRHSRLSNRMLWRRAATLHEAGFVVAVTKATDKQSITAPLAAAAISFQFEPFDVAVRNGQLFLVSMPASASRSSIFKSFVGVDLCAVARAAAELKAAVDAKGEQWQEIERLELAQAERDAAAKKEAVDEAAMNAVESGDAVCTRGRARAVDERRKRARVEPADALVVLEEGLAVVHADTIAAATVAGGGAAAEDEAEIDDDADANAGVGDSGAVPVPLPLNDDIDANAIGDDDVEEQEPDDGSVVSSKLTICESFARLVNRSVHGAQFIGMRHCPRNKRFVFDVLRFCDVIRSADAQSSNKSSLCRVLPRVAMEPNSATPSSTSSTTTTTTTTTTTAATTTTATTAPAPAGRSLLVNDIVWRKMRKNVGLLVNGALVPLSNRVELGNVVHLLFNVEANSLTAEQARKFALDGKLPPTNVDRPVFGFGGAGGSMRWCVDGVRLLIDKVLDKQQRTRARNAAGGASNMDMDDDDVDDDDVGDGGDGGGVTADNDGTDIVLGAAPKPKKAMPVSKLAPEEHRQRQQRQHAKNERRKASRQRRDRPARTAALGDTKTPKKPSDVFAKAYVADVTPDDLRDTLKSHKTFPHVVRLGAESVDAIDALCDDVVAELRQLAGRVRNGDEAARKVLGALMMRIRRDLVGSDKEPLSIVLVDGGEGGVTVTIGDDGSSAISIDLNDKQNVNFLRGRVTRGNRSAKSVRMLQRKQAYDEALVDLVSRKRVGGGRVLVLLADKFLKRQQTLALRLLQQSVMVVLVNEDFTSQKCFFHHVQVESLAEPRVEFVCADALNAVTKTLNGAAGATSTSAAATASKAPVCKAPPNGPVVEPLVGPDTGVVPTAPATRVEVRAQKLGYDKSEVQAAQRVSEAPMVAGAPKWVHKTMAQRLAADPVHVAAHPDKKSSFNDRVMKLDNLSKAAVEQLVQARIDDDNKARAARRAPPLTRREEFEIFFRVVTCTPDTERVLLQSRRNERKVMRRLAHLKSTEWAAKQGNTSDMDAGRAVRAQSFWQPLSQFTTRQLGERRKRWLARMRCDKCGTAAQRCSECLAKRAVSEVRLKCAGSGLCECAVGATKLKSVAQLAVTYRIEHQVESWRNKCCPGIPGQPETAHNFFRDIGSTSAVGMLAYVELTHGGRPAAFCHHN